MILSVKKMREEAASAGVYTSRWNTSHPRLQILTIEELLSGKKIDMPPWHESMTFKRAPKQRESGRGRGAVLRECEETYDPGTKGSINTQAARGRRKGGANTKAAGSG